MFMYVRSTPVKKEQRSTPYIVIIIAAWGESPSSSLWILTLNTNRGSLVQSPVGLTVSLAKPRAYSKVNLSRAPPLEPNNRNRSRKRIIIID